MVVNARENSIENKMVLIRQEMSALSKTTDNVVAQAAEEIRTSRDRNFAVQPGVPAGTEEEPEGEKVVYLTFDDGPSENTKRIMDILAQYDAKATFFVTGANEECRHYIKEAYDAGHTIGLHTYSHEYPDVYASDEAYFADLAKVGERVWTRFSAPKARVAWYYTSIVDALEPTLHETAMWKELKAAVSNVFPN